MQEIVPRIKLHVPVDRRVEQRLGFFQVLTCDSEYFKPVRLFRMEQTRLCPARLTVIERELVVSKLRAEDAWEAELRDVRSDYVQTVANISAAARAVMARSSRAVSRCDPSTYVRGKNYISYSFRSLYIRFPNILGLRRNAFLYPWQRSGAFCDGATSECTTTRVIRACLAAPESGRRFETIIERGGIFDFDWYYKGPIISDDRCEHDPMIGQYRQGSNDACLCSEPSTLKKNAYLNKSAVYSDVNNNRVITGIRFRTRWAITYLEVQEGEMVNGSVLPQSVRWREDVTRQLEDYERRHYVLPDDFELGKNDEYVALPDGVVNPNFDSSIVNLRRADVNFNLDDIILPAGMVVTGVKFEESQYFNGISLMIEGWEVFNSIGDFKFSDRRQWFSNDNYNSPYPYFEFGSSGLRQTYVGPPNSGGTRPVSAQLLDSLVDAIRFFMTGKRVNLDKCGDPLRGPKRNKELSTPGDSSVAFQLSDWNRDGSQSLIPFIDLQEVITNPPSPIGGLGIFYKGQEDHGGFISLKVFDMDDSIFMFTGRFALKAFFQWLFTGTIEP
ncbi:hypothetical protein EVAR_11585_1 [Eumeta japonica]|uniref:Uncharacterized protein n=1 Tax=Eumeta variegata TaxID=151549 RepID=A0A4C1X7S8_EUMVA|nr:hypothetical protein EVAR_11585_1 [Eumeta japonica]